MKKYNNEIHAFIAANVEGRTCKELAELTNQKFKTNFIKSSMKSYKANHKLKSHTRNGNAPGESKLFPKEVQEFIRANAQGKTDAELAALINDCFSIVYRENQIRWYRRNNHIKNGRDGKFKPGSIPPNKGKKGQCAEGCKKTWFKKGNTPFNHKPVGSERTCKDGFRLVKTAEPNVWRPKHLILWEQHNGLIPKGYKVVFLDSNRENIVIENLALVSHNELLILNRSKLKSEYPEITKVGITVAKVKNAVRRNKKNRNKGVLK